MRTLYTALILLITTCVYGQDYEKVITSGYSAHAITHNNSNGIVMAGEYGTKILIIRVDLSGDILWQQRVTFANNISTFAQPSIYQVIPTSDSSFLIAGATANPNENAKNAFLIKCAADGTIVWFKQYNNGSNTECTHGAVIETTDSNYIWSWGDLTTEVGFSHTRLDAAGTVLSNTNFSWNAPIEVSDIEILTDSTVLVAGNLIHQNAASSRGGFLSEISFDGNLVWSKTYHDQYFHDILTNDSNVFISGVYLEGISPHMLSILDHSGNIESLKNPNGKVANDLNFHSQMVFNTDSTLIMYTSDFGDPGIATTLNQDGTVIETYETFMPGNDLMATGNGGALFMGTGPRQGIKCLWITEIGLVQKDTTISSSPCFFPMNVQENVLPNTIIDNINFSAGTPSIEISDMASNFTTQLYTEDRCVTQLSSLHELENEFIQVYPNISDGIFHFVSTSLESMNLTILNTMGQIIYEEKNVQSEITIDLSQFSNGSYYYQAETHGGTNNNGLLILQK